MCPADSFETRNRDTNAFAAFHDMVHHLALRMARHLPSRIAVADLEQTAWVGVLEAMQRRPEAITDDEFRSLAFCRARGSILDWLRAEDRLPREVRRFLRNEARVRASVGVRASEETVAKQMALPLDRYRALRDRAHDMDTRVSDPEWLTGDGEEPDAFARLAEHEEAARVAQAVEHLPLRLRLIVQRVTVRGESLRSIGDSLGVTESRISQLHKEAVRQLRRLLNAPAETSLAPVSAAA